MSDRLFSKWSKNVILFASPAVRTGGLNDNNLAQLGRLRFVCLGVAVHLASSLSFPTDYKFFFLFNILLIFQQRNVDIV